MVDHVDSQEHAGPVANSISNDVVQLLRATFGRGPTKSRTYVLDDVVLCVLQEAATPEERRLAETGHADLAAAARQALREEIATQLRETVERHTGRRVRAVLGDFDPHERGVVALVFPLEP
jgi:uncharacterized protein YbcI